jgi:hypothetical protein
MPQVIAASALVISEARGLLEMAEPAWDYAAYHSIWAITAEDYELEGRLKALEVKVSCDVNTSMLALGLLECGQVEVRCLVWDQSTTAYGSSLQKTMSLKAG